MKNVAHQLIRRYIFKKGLRSKGRPLKAKTHVSFIAELAHSTKESCRSREHRGEEKWQRTACG